MKFGYLSLVILMLSGCLNIPPPQGGYAAPANNVCSVIAGATIVASDGKYLGKITNQYDSDSVLNDYGSYGGTYSATSIWNQYGSYGGEYSANSPFNEFSSSPPRIVKDGSVIGYLTVSQNLANSLNPYVIKSCKFY